MKTSKEITAMKFNIRLTLYFEISGSYLYGGEDSVGYLSIEIGLSSIDYEKDNFFNKREIMEEYISEQIRHVAKLCSVPIENVHVISKEEYDANSDEED